MTSKTVSFRASLQGEVADFLRDESMGCDATAEGLAELLVSLSRYKEEGVALFPTVFITDKAETMLRLITGQDLVPLGQGPRSKATMHKALKNCAPLARKGWAIYLERRAAEFAYGVFRISHHPFAITPAEGIVNTELPITMAIQLAENVVEIAGSSGKSLQIHLSAARSDQVSPRLALEISPPPSRKSSSMKMRQIPAGFSQRPSRGFCS